MSLLKWVPFNSTKYRTGTPHVRATLIIPNDVFLNILQRPLIYVYSMAVDDANQHYQVTSLYLPQATVYLATAY